MKNETIKFTCPICGYKVFAEPPGSHDICPICGWEDDVVQLRFVKLAGGANKISLIEAQDNFRKNGIAKPHSSFISLLRQPIADDEKDTKWRIFDPSIDDIEVAEPRKEYGNTYPSRIEELYYWRKL